MRKWRLSSCLILLFVFCSCSADPIESSIGLSSSVSATQLAFQPAFYKTLFRKDAYITREGILIIKPEFTEYNPENNFLEPDERPMDSILDDGLLSPALYEHTGSNWAIAGIPQTGRLFAKEDTSSEKYKWPENVRNTEPRFSTKYDEHLKQTVERMQAWNDVQQVEEVRSPRLTCVLKKDGTIEVVQMDSALTPENKEVREFLEAVTSWKSIRAISTSGTAIAAITKDGAVLYASTDVRGEAATLQLPRNTIQAIPYKGGVVILQNDGTLTAPGIDSDLVVDRNIHTLVRGSDATLGEDGYIRRLFDADFLPIGRVENVQDVVQVQELYPNEFYVLYQNGTIQKYRNEAGAVDRTKSEIDYWLRSRTDVKTN